MKWIGTVLIFTLLTGCATVLMKDQEPTAIDSRPSGANAVVQCAGGTRGSTVTKGRRFRHFPDEINKSLEPIR